MEIMMERITMIVGGKIAVVPAEHAEKVAKKEMLVSRASVLQDLIKADKEGLISTVANRELQKIVSKIISLNRRIPACVSFPTEYRI